MNKEELTKLGLNEDQVKSVINMNDKSVQSIKDQYKDTDNLKSENEDLKKQVSKYGKDLKELQKKAGDNEELNSTIQKLRDEKKSIQEAADKRFLDSKIDGSLASNNVRSNKAARAMLNMDDVKLDDDNNLIGLDDQLKVLKNDNPWMFNEGSSQDYNPRGGSGDDSKSNVEALKEAWK